MCVCMCGRVRGNVCFVVEVSTKVESKCVCLGRFKYVSGVQVRTHGLTFILVGVGMMLYFDHKRGWRVRGTHNQNEFRFLYRIMLLRTMT